MPAQRPRARFEPISPDLDLKALVEGTPNFEYVTRVHCNVINQQGLEAFDKAVLRHVVHGGKPLVIEGFQERLDRWTFAAQWLQDNYGKKFENARNLSKGEDLPLSISHYLNHMAVLTNQWNTYNYKDTNRQRIYLKDIDCPQVWHDKLKHQLPPSVFYLNENTGEIGGPGAVDEPDPRGPGMKKGRGVARAGDLMSSLPLEMRAENLMCYIGHEGTYTPAHREMCASLGQNIMVETSGTLDEGGKPSKPGSSIWFMTETKDRFLVSEYWLSTLGHDIEIENHFAQVNAWKAAPFKAYIVEQRAGDLILIPPLAPHQVWNRGTRTMKVAWNRTTVETLEMALGEALPGARMVCRDEQYKNKAIVYYTLQKYSLLLKQVESQNQSMLVSDLHSPPNRGLKIRGLKRDFRRLFALYSTILLSEMFSLELPSEKKVEYLPYDSNVTCSYCRCNIFNRFLTCPTCVIPYGEGQEDTYDICMDCYAMGRSCECISKLRWVEQFPWAVLIENYEAWRQQIISLGGITNGRLPQSLETERAQMKKKTLAQICQEQLRIRPWRDISKPLVREPIEIEDEGQVNDDGTIKKRRKLRHSAKWHKEHTPCHVCRSRDPNWKLAFCSCGQAYCFGSLWRGFDLMPQTILENPSWKCPKCLKICSCHRCKDNPDMKPFEPTGTLLGHDTKKIADIRSVESLVDFSHSNIQWLKKFRDDHPYETRRLQKKREEAEKAKLKTTTLSDHSGDEDESGPVGTGSINDVILYSPNGGISIESSRTSLQGSPVNSENHNNTARQISPSLPTVSLLSESSTQNRVELPPLSRALDGQFSSQAEPLRRLTPDQGQEMSVLERSPETFASLAGLESRDRPQGPNASTAASNTRLGPEVIQPFPSVVGPTMVPDLESQRYQSLQRIAAEASRIQEGRKRKRQDFTPFLEPFAQDDANRQYQQAQLHRAFSEARRHDRYISAQAAARGQSLRVILQIDKSKLARIANLPSPTQTIPSVGSQSREETGELILQSDLPLTQTETRDLAEGTDDEDFSIKNGPLNHKKRGRPRRTTKLGDMNFDDEDSDDVQVPTFDVQSRQGSKPGRRVPAYLARRYGDHEENTGDSISPSTSSRREATQESSANMSRETSSSIAGTNTNKNLSIAHPVMVDEVIQDIELQYQPDSNNDSRKATPLSTDNDIDPESMQLDVIRGDFNDQIGDIVEEVTAILPIHDYREVSSESTISSGKISVTAVSIPKGHRKVEGTTALNPREGTSKPKQTKPTPESHDQHHLSEVEKNLRAKMMAMRWAEGDDDDIFSNSSSESWVSNNGDIGDLPVQRSHKSPTSPSKAKNKKAIRSSSPLSLDGLAKAPRGARRMQNMSPDLKALATEKKNLTPKRPRGRPRKSEVRR
ncbi:MAG: hypothetical protein M1834_004470 [Cirrosporium novae-zelandiae]|nr:MAG: hypothetical protein M1834_004470 [Cirrosporium novae-zelandiae]